MKYILFIVLLLLPVSGWAEFDPLPHCYGEPGLIRVPCGEHELKLLLDRKQCAERMESAMRAMEPYLLNGIGLKDDSPEYAKKITAQSPVFTQWLNVKRACWKETP